LVASGISTGASLLNPHGIQALLYPFSYAGTANASMRFIAEWQSPDFHQLSYLVFGGSVVFGVALGVVQRPLGLTQSLWVLSLAAMALQSARNIPLYAVVATPLLAARLQEMVPVLRRRVSDLPLSWLLALIWPLLMVSIVGTLVQPVQRATLQLGIEPSSASYPMGAVEYIKTNQPNGNMFNDYGWGGYLAYQLYPERKVFIDGRADVYGDKLVESYVNIVQLEAGWRNALNEHDLRIVLVRNESPLAVALAASTEWREVYAGPVERLFVR
jgi:hypothetical protein